MFKSLNIYITIFLFLITARLAAQQTEKMMLSGTGFGDTKNWDFFCTDGANSGKWTSIAVPSNWELQGFGKYNYGFNKEVNKGKEKGLYKYSFTVADTWKNKKINLVFDGVMTDAEVKINGKVAGEIHQGSFYQFKYDVTELIKFQESNVLEVTVSKHSTNKSINAAEREADYWIFGGIFRPVFLEALPKQHIQQVSIDAKADGSFSAKLLHQGEAQKLVLEVFDQSGEKLGKHQQSLSGNSNLIKTTFKAPKLWSAEFPNLYKAVFSLYDGSKLVHQISKNIGFRTVELRERDGVYINGVKIKFKGVNHHSFWPESGRTTSKTISINDVKLIKEMNMNAIRMAHYPPDSHLLEACDSLGLYVMNELAGWHGHYDTPTGTKLLKEMFARDENHPSIIFWANGNEGGHNTDLDALFTQLDIQKRPVIHPWEIYGGFETTHYREYNYGIGNYDQGRNIVMPTEFLHGMFDGGHGAGLEDYWKAMWSNPLSAGGFLWDFADQGVVRTDKNGILDTDGNHGADGIVGPHHEKEGSFYAIKEIWSPVFIERREITPAFDGKLTVENRYHITNLNQCSFSFKLSRLATQGENTIKTGKIEAPNLKPLEKGLLQMLLPTDWNTFDVLYVTAKDVYGQEIFTWSFPITRPENTLKAALANLSKNKVEVQENANAFILKVADLQLSINKTTGILEQVQNQKGIIPFNNGPFIQEGATNFKNFSLKQDGDNIIISSSFDKKESFNTLQWTIYPSGMVKMQVKYFPESYFTKYVGVNFSFPEEQIKGVEFMGFGPYRVWKNRMKGNQFGIWKKDYNDNSTGEIPFEYPEFKGYYANMYWCKFITKKQSFKVYTDKEDIFLRLFTPKKQKDTTWENMQMTFPSGDISFMNGIAAIGTKTQKPETTGPMGMKHIYYDFEKEPKRALDMTLYFDFTGKN
ncbi:glycoside hydrolase family 2 protein [Pedobacter glucosidilyticus]|uniref:glycoside hydrolase family 2 protein n=1 Tax=Pedobacter glucosidilyticus TaxID=1122941 RepID=UPI0026EB9402|nr:glycoside hydrolase family 2 TIM barrel-domain containing protein [Pedobacter glucosidilyticus]